MQGAQAADACAPSAITLEPIARERAATLQNLFELYAHDFSEVLPLALGEDGRFGHVIAEEWWTGEGHWPFFIRKEGQLAGFALVRRGSRVTQDASVLDMAEFFVTRAARRQGVGALVARDLFRRLPGTWEIRVRRNHEQALAFWTRVLEDTQGVPIAKSEVSIQGVEWWLFRESLG